MSSSDMVFTKHVSLADWIDAINRDPDKGVLSSIKVKHRIDTPVGMRDGDEVYGTIIAQGKPWSAKELAAQIKGRCEVFSQALPGHQTFKVYGYHGQDEPTSFHHINAEGRASGHDGVSEDASPKGMAMQGMRMGDGVVNRAFQMHDQLWQVSKHLMAEMKIDRDEWRSEARDGFKIINEMVQQQVKDNHVQKMEELKFQRATGEREKLMIMLPALLRFITKDKDLIPDGMGDTAILTSAANAIRKMDKSQQTATMTQLVGVSPELAMILGSRLGELTEQLEREDKARVLLSQGRTAEQAERDEQLAKEILARANGDASALSVVQVQSDEERH